MLWALAFLALLAAPVMRLSAECIAAQRAAQRILRSRWQGQAAIAFALHELLAGQQGWAADGNAHLVAMQGSVVSVTVEDEAGKIDLNAAPADLLSNLFRAAGSDTAKADGLAAAVIAWRTPAGRPAQPDAPDVQAKSWTKHGPFNSIDELEQVPGFSRLDIVRLRSNLTVFSPRGGVNRAAAPQLVRAALNSGLSSTAEDEAPAAPDLDMPADVLLNGRALTIRATVGEATKAPLVLEQTVRFVDDRANRIRVLGWRQVIAPVPRDE